MSILLPRPAGTPSKIEGELRPRRCRGAVAGKRIITRVLARDKANRLTDTFCTEMIASVVHTKLE